MKIIITGATGFVGRHLAERLHEDGFQVVGLGRSTDAGDALQEQGIVFRQADVCDASQTIEAISAAECVIHCAGKSGPWGRFRDFYKTNVIGTRNVVAACQHYKIEKLIFISSPSIYHTGEDRYDISENDPLPKRQASNYGRSKLIVENELMDMEGSGFRTIIFRPRAIVGPYDNTFVPRILRMAEKKHMPLINEGRALVDLTYIDDFNEAVKKALIAPVDAWNQVYNISSGNPITVKEWISIILQLFNRPFRPKNIPESLAMFMAATMEFVSYLPFVGREPPMTRFSVGYMAKSMTMNIEKAAVRLGFRPNVGKAEGFKRLANGLTSAGNE